MAFMEKENVSVKIEPNSLTNQVCRLKQTCTPTGAARKYLTTITDAFLLNYAVTLDETRDGPKKIPRACGLVITYRQSPAAAVGIVTCTNVLFQQTTSPIVSGLFCRVQKKHTKIDT